MSLFAEQFDRGELFSARTQPIRTMVVLPLHKALQFDGESVFPLCWGIGVCLDEVIGLQGVRKLLPSLSGEVSSPDTVYSDLAVVEVSGPGH